MAEGDLLILTLLKIPVAIIRYFSTSMAILTYLPNYLLILALDAVIFSATLSKSAIAYILSWPIRFASLIGVIYLFGIQLYYLYKLLGVEQMHWGWQALLMLITSQIILGLMRHGYLSMIKKFDPIKLKSPLEHIIEIINFIIDILTFILVLVNLLLVINAAQTFAFTYQQPSQASRLAKKRPTKNEQYTKSQNSHPYFIHVINCIHRSILAYVHLFYIKIFFRIFPWRYLHAIQSVKAEENNILNLTVLLTLLFLGTIVDLIFFAIFGLYCFYVHPRRNVYRKQLKKSEKKYRITCWFLLNSVVQILELVVLIPCLPFKWNHTKNLMKLITYTHNDYSRHFWFEVLYVIKLTLLKIPSLVCLVFVFLSIYKFRKMNILRKAHQQEVKKYEMKLLEQKQAGAGAEQSVDQSAKQKYSKQSKSNEKEYIIFKCFGELIEEFPLWLFVIPNTIMKPWNIFWVKYCLDSNLCLRKRVVWEYFCKNITDYAMGIPSMIAMIIQSIYDPLQVKNNLVQQMDNRSKRKSKISMGQVLNRFQFFSIDASLNTHMFSKTLLSIIKDIFFIPLFIITRLSFICCMGCPHPSSSVQLVEKLWTQFYQRRVKKSPHYKQYQQFLQMDKAAGLIVTQRDHLQFWKFAHKSCRHRIIAWILCKLLPKRRAQRVKANVKIVRGYSTISNHYWHRYQITWALLSAVLFFTIQLIVTLIGVLVLMPLTLWRLPTFLILLKIHEYKKKMFFPILGKVYIQMFLDICSSFIRLICLLLFPRSTLDFYRLTAFRYHPEGVKKFLQTQKLKQQYLVKSILGQNIIFYVLMVKVGIIKTLWIRKRDFNNSLNQQKILLRKLIKNFVFKRQIHPTFEELLNFNYVPDAGLNVLPHQKIIDRYFYEAMEDLPYLLLSLFLVCTLPWRIFYIKNSILLLRQHRRNRTQFHSLVRKIAKDYLCILLYIVLLLSVVKTKRVLILIYRNVKLNFYVGYLKYSHLKELQKQLIQAGNFYKSFWILIIAIAFGPYRFNQTRKQVFNLYKQQREARKEKEKLQKIHQNTVKEGKQLQLLTTVGYQSLISICDYLEPKQLTRMTSVCKYLYEGIKQNEEIWQKQWDRLYALKYPQLIVKNEAGENNFNEMCVKSYVKSLKENGKNKPSDLYELAMKQLKINLFQSHFDIKETLYQNTTERTFKKLFKQVLRYNIRQGFGPQQFWPQPEDNEEYLALMGIERRAFEPQLSQQKAIVFWLFYQPVEYLIVRLNRFYNNEQRRRLKQLLFVFTTFILPPWVVYKSIRSLWSWFWTLDSLIGCKIAGLIYSIALIVIFVMRYSKQLDVWASLHPFNLVDDVRIGFEWVIMKMAECWRWILGKMTLTFNFVSDKAKKTGRFIKVQIIDRLMIPIRWLGRKIAVFFKWLGRKIAVCYNFFVQKVAIPLYQSIARYITLIFNMFVSLWKFTINTLLALYHFLANLLKKGFKMMIALARNISQFYSKILENSLIFALSFGMIGQLIFTIIVIAVMFSPSMICYWWVRQRWFIIMSSILTMTLIATGYKHLSRVKNARERSNRQK